MPMYAFRCPHCGARRTELRPIGRRNDLVPCGICHEPCARDLNAEMVASPDVPYERPILSESMGVAPAQVEEHRRVHPSIPMTDDGRVIVASHAEGKRIRRELGFYDKNGFCR